LFTPVETTRRFVDETGVIEVLLSHMRPLILGAWILVRIAARVYEFALLHSGSRVRWGQLWLLIRGGELV